jgi:hypothetical protein
LEQSLSGDDGAVRKENILDISMMVPVPMCGWTAWRYHIVEKSPRVQPTRHLRVLTPARLHIGVDDQKCVENRDGEAAGEDTTFRALQVVWDVLLLQDECVDDDAMAI